MGSKFLRHTPWGPDVTYMEAAHLTVNIDFPNYTIDFVFFREIEWLLMCNIFVQVDTH